MRITLYLNLLGQLLAMAMHDQIFVATIKDVDDIYRVPTPQEGPAIEDQERQTGSPYLS
jgi:hypothetical protein